MPDTTPPTWDTVKRLFSGADIGFMQMYGFNLDDYEFVAKNIDALLSRIEDGSMPPKPEFAPWSQEKIQMLRDWKAAGFPRSAPVNAELTKFIRMSEFLTGFDDLHADPGLAAWYLNRLKTRPENGDSGNSEKAVNQADLAALMAGFDPSDTASFESDTLTKPACESVARTIILLWYTASFIDLGSGFAAEGGTGTPADNRYIAGLMWRAFHAHPMGYSSEGWYDHETGKYSLGGKPYWQFKPEPNGQNTGLGPNSVEP